YAREAAGVFRMALAGDGSVDPDWHVNLVGVMQPYALGVDAQAGEVVAAGTDSAGYTLMLARLGTSVPPAVTTFAHPDVGATVVMFDVEAGPGGHVAVAAPFRAGLPSLL